MRRSSTIVLAHEVVDDMLLELALEVHVVVARADCVAHAAGVLHILDRTAALVQRRGGLVLHRPQAQRYAHDIITLLLQQQGGNGGVHSPAHCDYDTLGIHRMSVTYGVERFNGFAPLLAFSERRTPALQ